jgi:hypothetical protein
MPFTDSSLLQGTTSEYPFFREYFVEDFELQNALCNIWRVGEAQAHDNAPVVSDIPTLVLAGQYDPITPPGWGRQAAETLRNSYFYEFPGFGHGISVLGDCPTNLTLAFLNDPTSTPDASCIAQIGLPQFVSPPVAQFQPAVLLVPVQNGGNLRSEPALAPETVIGQVCPGDLVVVQEERQVGDIRWNRVVVDQVGSTCHANRVPAGTEGWISSVLLN